jgi:DNA-binding CsgD family transcriptional regulator
MLSPQELSSLIGAIYDCALDPGRWPVALDHVRDALSFRIATIAHLDLRKGAIMWDFTSGVEQPWLDAMAGFSEDTVTLWGGPARMNSFPLEEPVLLSAVTNPQEWNDNRVYRDWVAPQDIHDLVGLSILRDRLSIAALALMRARAAGPVGEDELIALRLLVPHLKRALEISRILEAQVVTAATFGTVLDGLAAAVFLVDGNLVVLHANEAGRRMLDSGDPIALRRNALEVREPEGASVALRLAIGRAARSDIVGRTGLGVPVQTTDGVPLVLHVLPLRHGALRSRIEPRATAAVFVAPSVTPPPLPLDAVVALFDLTPAEARVLDLVAAGRGREEAAAALGIQVNTLKTHLLRIFEKTGCRRQPELVALMAAFRTPFADG